MQPSRPSQIYPKPVSKFPFWKWVFICISSLILVSLLSGCFSAKEKIVVKVQNNYAEIVCPDPMKPVPTNSKPINPEAIQDKAGIWWVGITPDEYGNLAINTEDSIRFIKDQTESLPTTKNVFLDSTK